MIQGKVDCLGGNHCLIGNNDRLYFHGGKIKAVFPVLKPENVILLFDHGSGRIDNELNKQTPDDEMNLNSLKKNNQTMG